VKNLLIMSCIVLALGLRACTSSTKVAPQVDFEFLPSNKDSVSKSVFADIKSIRAPLDSFFYDPKSEEFSCAMELVDRRVFADARELLDHQIDPSSNRTFLSVVRVKTNVFAKVNIVKPITLNSNYEIIGGLVYQIADGCDSIVHVLSDDY